MGFKVGDKVKVCDSSRWKKRIKDTIGIVKSISGDRISVKWGTEKCIICGIETPCRYPENMWRHESYEIEPAIEIGQQLLLFEL